MFKDAYSHYVDSLEELADMQKKSDSNLFNLEDSVHSLTRIKLNEFEGL